MSIVGLLAADIVLSALGAGVLMAIGSWARLARWSRLGPSLLVGFASAAVVLPPLLYVGVSPTPIVVAVLAALSLATGSVLARRRPRIDAAPSGGGLWTALIVAVLLAPFTIRAAFEPILKFDAYSDWSLKARLIYGHGGLLLGAFDPHTLGSLYQPGHREYPLGIPVTEAFAFHMAGSASARIIHLQCLAIFLAFAATAWSLLRPRVDPAILGAVLCLLAVAPSLHTQILSTYADVPLSAVWALAAISLGLWIAGDGADRLAFATVLAAAALAIKQEGLVLDAALVAVAIVFALTTRKRGVLRGLVASAGVAVITAVPWQIRVHSLGLHDADIDPTPSRMAHQAHALPTIVHRLAVELLGTRWPGIVPLAVVAAAWLAWTRRDRMAVAFLALLATSSLGLVFIYWNARIAIAPLLVESAERVVTGPVFLAVVTLPLLLDALASAQRTDAGPGRRARRPRARARQ
jgi:hypothetical protein